jgi:predicted porin
MWADDGFQNRWFHVDAQPSSTRFGFTGMSQVMPGLRAGGRLESEMKSNPSDTVSFGTPSTGAGPGGAVAFTERWLDVWLEGGWGRVEFGQGSGAADDASTLDLSGTGMANGNCVCDWGGGIVWRNSAGGSLGTNVVSTHANNDFESRHDRIRYITPVFGGLKAQVGVGQRTAVGESREASLWYAGKLAGDFVAAIGRSNVNFTTEPPGPSDRVTTGGSASWLHTSGFNVSLWLTRTDGISTGDPGMTGKFTGGKVGYKFGQHAIGVDYGMHDDMVLRGDEGKTYGIGYVWNPVRWFEIFAQIRQFELDRPGVEVEDIKVGSIGSRVRF